MTRNYEQHCMTLACLGGTAKRLCKQQDGNDRPHHIWTSAKNHKLGSEVGRTRRSKRTSMPRRLGPDRGSVAAAKKKKKCLPGLTETKRRWGKEGMAVGLRLS